MEFYSCVALNSIVFIDLHASFKYFNFKNINNENIITKRA